MVQTDVPCLTATRARPDEPNDVRSQRVWTTTGTAFVGN